MATYTEFYFNAKLRRDTPKGILDLLDGIVNRHEAFYQQISGKEIPVISSVDQTPTLPIDHTFGKNPRWQMLFHSNNWGAIENGGSKFTNVSYPRLIIHTEFKNYDGLINSFIDWITPHIASRKKRLFVGYKRIEFMDQENIYLDKSNK